MLIALDLDGTVLHQDRVISPGVQQAISAARSAGHLVTVITGRRLESALPWAKELA
ncbi:MAG: HAD hydrolase family protein, partial [Deinococcus sp.]|nr:HAD hydrolase family protein [Deinococcus sp.]